MLMKRLLGALCLAVLASCASLGDVAAPQEEANARFDWFEYAGHDEIFETPLAEGEYRRVIASILAIAEGVTA